MREAGAGSTRHRLFAGAVAVALVLGVVAPALPAGAHGVPDQGSGTAGTTGPCSPAEFPGTKLITTGESRQSFVPTEPGLASIDLCIANLVGILGTDFTVKIYAGETNLTTPGTPIAAVPADAGDGFLDSRWVHIDMPAELATTPGATYVIGLAPATGALSTLSFQWRSTCADSLLTSCQGVADRYPSGRPNDLPANADYGFRTAGLEDADLVGQVSVPPVVCPGLDLAGRATASVTNDSTRSVGSFVTDWVWSTDALLDPTDRVISGSRTTVPGLAPNATATIPPPVLPADLPQGDGHLLLHLDADNQVIEVDDMNNLIAGPTTVTACGQPAITGVSVSIDETQVQTGFGQRQFSNLDPAALASLPQSIAEAQAGPAVSPNGVSPNGVSPNGVSPNGVSGTGLAPNGVSPNGVSPNGVSPNGVSPNGVSDNVFSAARGVLVSAIVDDLPAGTGDRILVANIPATFDWADRLGTDQAIQDITLTRALQLAPDITMGEIDFSAVHSASWLAIALADIALANLPPPAGQTWCQYLATQAFSCATTGFNPATMSILNLEARGFPAPKLPIGTQPLSTVNVAGAVVGSFPLIGSPRFNLEHTRLGQLALDTAFTDPNVVARCDIFNCARTVVEAQANDALRDIDVATMLGALSPAGRAGTIVGDLAMGTASVTSLRLSSANWNVADAYQIDAACPRMTYRVNGSNTGSARSIDPTAVVTLGTGFVYIPGTAQLVADGGAPTPQAEPSVQVSANGTRTYTFGLEGVVNQSFSLRFSACASQYLGEVAAGSATVSGVGLDGPYSGASPATGDRVQVVERTPGVTTTALAFADNVVVADHISEAGAYDSWTTPISTTPRTLYMAQLWVPPGTDYDLLAFGPATSAAGFTAPGFAPNAVSPNGVSPNGVSPNGVSPNGVSPNGVSPNGVSPNGVSANGDNYTNQPEVLADIPIQELRPGGVNGTAPYAISAHRGDAPETIFWYSNFGDSGNLTFAVADYNGERSDAPYFFTLQRFAPELDPRLATCQAAPYGALTVPGSSAPVTSATPNPRTLIVTNRQVSNSVYGTSATDAGMTALSSLAARPELAGVVVDVSQNRNVATAMNTWRGRWCEPQAANAAASHIRSLILDYRTAYPSIDTVVLAGDDFMLPDFRLPDAASLGNESQYITPLLNATGANNALVAAFANATLMTADPYGNDGAIGFGTTYAFLPSAGVSRLVEGPAAWTLAQQQYVAASGNLDPADGMVSGYDGMVDGAEAVADVLDGADIPTTRLTDTTRSWNAGDFRQSAFTASPDIAGYNGHANHWTLLSDAGSDTGNTADAVSTAEAASIALGGIIFSNGCHFGTSVADALNPAPNSSAENTRLADWNQAITSRRGIAVTNSGFGIFDTITVGQGERLQELFVQELMTAPNASIALARAKNTFFATAGVLDAITYKSVHQLQLYGLGVFKMLGASRTPTAPPRPTSTAATPVSSGTYAVAPVGTTSCVNCFIRRPTENGTAIDLSSTVGTASHTSVNGYFSAPTLYQWTPTPAGQQSIGIWWTGGQTQRLADIDPVITRAAISRPDREPEAQYLSISPTSFGSVADIGGRTLVNMMMAVNRNNTLVDGRVRGDVYVNTNLTGEVHWRPLNTTGCPSHIDEVTASEPLTSGPMVVDVVVSAACGPVARVAVLGRDANGTWLYREAGRGANGHWSTSLPRGVRDVVVQATNNRTITYWHNKGDELLTLVNRAEGATLNVNGPQTGGVYTGTVTGSVTVGGGATCRVHDGDHLLGTFASGAPFSISGEGSHELTAQCTDGSWATTAFAIDISAPVITVLTPPSGATYGYQQVVIFDAIVSDAGTGATGSFTNDGQPIADGQPLRTGTTGTHTLTGSFTDAAGHTTTYSGTYTVTSRYTISQFMSPIAAKPTLNTVSKNSTITVKFTVTDTVTGTQTTDVGIIASRQWFPINCNSKARTGAGFFTTGTTPEYTGGTFHFNISAPSPVGNCYELVVTLVDGATQSAYFKTKN